jgi:hypothetical protein
VGRAPRVAVVEGQKINILNLKICFPALSKFEITKPSVKKIIRDFFNFIISFWCDHYDYPSRVPKKPSYVTACAC